MTVFSGTIFINWAVVKYRNMSVLNSVTIWPCWKLLSPWLVSDQVGIIARLCGLIQILKCLHPLHHLPLNLRIATLLYSSVNIPKDQANEQVGNLNWWMVAINWFDWWAIWKGLLINLCKKSKCISLWVGLVTWAMKIQASRWMTPMRAYGGNIYMFPLYEPRASNLRCCPVQCIHS